ncbi:MAG: hydrogenase 3 maturation endopeptidase HyCI [Candidatus Omnitrophica bacterium]|nr:hydrogenase 3 maturation endopeptidase HyCI [Candidatus Omnitrophota bacterium]
MNFWKRHLKMKLQGFKQLGIMCIGNRYCSDDGAGVEVARVLSIFLNKKKCRNISVINCYNSPENFTSSVKKIKPSHILIIDSCISGKRPGAISILAAKDIKEYNMLSHRIPIRLLSDYIASEIGSDIIILGIEPECTARGTDISKPVKKAIKEIERFFVEFLRDIKKL